MQSARRNDKKTRREPEAQLKIYRLLIPAAIAIAAVFIITACAGHRLTDPLCEGRPLSHWMDDLTNSWGDTDIHAAILSREQTFTNLVRELGPEALPMYLKGIQDTEHPGRNYGSSLAFGILGPVAEPAIPDLVQLLQNNNTVRGAANALVAIGPASIPALIGVMGIVSNRSQYVVISALGQFGSAAVASSPILIRIIETNSVSSDAAIRTLVEIETNRNDLIPLFAQHIADSNAVLGANYALGRLGKPGIPVLLQSLTNESRHVRAFAEGALDPDFQKFSFDRTNNSAPSFMRLISLYNLKVMGAASESYSEGDFRMAAKTAGNFLNDRNPAIQMAASNAFLYLTPLAQTNISQRMIDGN